MTNYVQARATIVDHINTRLTADKPQLKVFYENTVKVDTNTVGDQFVKISIDFLASRQSTIEFMPKQRVLGEVTALLMYKEGKGTAETLQLFDYLTGLLGHKVLGSVVLRTPTPGKKSVDNGWCSFELYIPFIFDWSDQ